MVGAFPWVNLVGVKTQVRGIREDITDAQVQQVPSGSLSPLDLSQYVKCGVVPRAVFLSVGHDGDDDASGGTVPALVPADEGERFTDCVVQRRAATGLVVSLRQDLPSRCFVVGEHIEDVVAVERDDRYGRFGVVGPHVVGQSVDFFDHCRGEWPH